MPSQQRVVPPMPRGITRASRMRDLLREQILAGHFTDGLLPSEQALMLEYAASRATVRDALQLLRAERLVERRQGTGTMVVRRKSFHPFDRMHGIGEASHRRLLSTVNHEVIPAPRPVAQFFGLRPGGDCLVVEFDTSVGGEPFSTAISYLPADCAATLPQGEVDGDFYEFLEAGGTVVDSGDLLVEAVSAEEGTARRLGVATGAPLMLFRRRLYSPGGHPLEIGFVRCRGDQLALVTRLPRHAGGTTC